MAARASRLAAIAVALLLAGCAPTRLQGVNLLQSRTVSFEQAPTAASLARLRALGANTVAIVVFLAQADARATEVVRSPAVSEAQLVAAIRAARGQGLRVQVKVQMLVPDSWAGGIEPSDEAGWAAWFASYTAHVVALARIAAAEGAEGLVLGTELRRADARPEWAQTIAAVRAVYRGELSYAAHNVEGLAAFAHWDRLDSVALTLYPSLGASPARDAMRARVDAAVAELRSVAPGVAKNKPLWIAELGVPSRSGAQARPWEWQQPLAGAPDGGLQADVIDLWLHALRGDWHRGVLLWAWSNDPGAGGPADADYLLQNKPVEAVLRCHWSREC